MGYDIPDGPDGHARRLIQKFERFDGAGARPLSFESLEAEGEELVERRRTDPGRNLELEKPTPLSDDEYERLMAEGITVWHTTAGPGFYASQEEARVAFEWVHAAKEQTARLQARNEERRRRLRPRPSGPIR